MVRSYVANVIGHHIRLPMLKIAESSVQDRDWYQFVEGVQVTLCLSNAAYQLCGPPTSPYATGKPSTRPGERSHVFIAWREQSGHTYGMRIRNKAARPK